MVQRTAYVERLLSWKDKQLIKVVTGVRRCGKSTLFLLYMDYLREHGVAEKQIISVNLEDIENERLLEYKELYRYICERLIKDKPMYVFIDEVQQCLQFEKAVNSLFIKKNVDIYITGSNANMLSGELATLLSGRYVEIPMLPFSFSEYIAFTGETDKRAGFNSYMRRGSFPYVAVVGNDEALARTYLDGIYNTILVKDIALRENITDISLLESIVKFLCGNIGSPVSVKKISDTIQSGGRKISVNTVDRYLRALQQSFIFYRADRYDIKGKQMLKTQNKYYLVDTGLRNLLLARSSADLGYQLENIVYFELLRRGYKVNIGKIGEREIDFVAESGGEITYVQVSASVLEEGTLMRELEPLRKIRDNHPKLLLTLDEIMPTSNHDGIRQTNALDWLTSR